MTRNYNETPLQMAVADYLKGEMWVGKSVIRVQVPFPGLVWTYTGGEGRDKTDGFWLKRKGRRKGVSDYLSWFLDIGFQAIETKAEDGYLDIDQKAFFRDFQQAGGKTCVARSVAEVRDFYIGLGIPCKNTNAIEPKLSFERRKELWNEFQRPPQ